MTTVDANYQEWDFGHTADFPDGPWKNEPDKVQWIDTATGLDCLIVRQSSHGAFCGYVGLPPWHPLHGVDYDTAYERAEIDVHGGLTFASDCNKTNPEGVCHIPASGRPEDVWWLGFDCVHGGDLAPGHLKWGVTLSDHDVYRDVAYVRSEIESLAKQLEAAA